MTPDGLELVLEYVSRRVGFAVAQLEVATELCASGTLSWLYS